MYSTGETLLSFLWKLFKKRTYLAIGPIDCRYTKDSEIKPFSITKRCFFFGRRTKPCCSSLDLSSFWILECRLLRLLAILAGSWSWRRSLDVLLTGIQGFSFPFNASRSSSSHYPIDPLFFPSFFRSLFASHLVDLSASFFSHRSTFLRPLFPASLGRLQSDLIAMMTMTAKTLARSACVRSRKRNTHRWN